MPAAPLRAPALFLGLALVLLRPRSLPGQRTTLTETQMQLIPILLI